MIPSNLLALRSSNGNSNSPSTVAAGHNRQSRQPQESSNDRSSSLVAARTIKKSVTFDTMVRNYIVPSHRDMDEAQKESIWRTEDDINANDQEIIKTACAIVKMKNASLPTQNDADDEMASICARGLECLVIGTDARRRREQHKLELIDAVLDVQGSQWQMGNYHADPDILRATSESHSNEDVCRALTLAAADAAFVRLAMHVIG